MTCSTQVLYCAMIWKNFNKYSIFLYFPPFVVAAVWFQELTARTALKMAHTQV